MIQTKLTLTRQDARRLAITRQHLDGRTPPTMLDLIRNLGCVQLDPIRHVERTHRLVLFSRLGAFDEAELERLRWEDRALFEYWAHAASLVLTEELPVHAYTMHRYRDPAHSRNARYVQDWMMAEPEVRTLHDEILHTLRVQGPQLSRTFEHEASMPSRWSNGRYVSRLLDYLWTTGEVTVYGRPGNQRLWGVAESFWPAGTPQDVWHGAQLTHFSAQKALRALGVATPQQIKRHYTRSVYPELPKVLRQLVHEGLIEPVTVLADDGAPLPGDWYVHTADLPLLQAIQQGDWHGRTTLLSPFDNLICDRERTELLWDFFYRIEIYLPAAKREYGYYVLPILHNDALIGRVDSTMDRRTGQYLVHRVYAEPHAPADMDVAVATAVTELAAFLQANEVVWGKGDA
jgi:uncharacterized protein YcaQ